MGGGTIEMRSKTRHDYADYNPPIAKKQLKRPESIDYH
jgi:hypothetical protein